MSIKIVGDKKLVRALNRLGKVAEREIARANLSTGFQVLTSTRQSLSEQGAIDTGGLTASYHVEGTNGQGGVSYWQGRGRKGNGTYEGSDGQTKQGWIHAPVTDDTVVVGSRAQHAAVTEYGRSAGARMPPPDALKPWLRRHGLPENLAFVVARSIAQKGIPARPALVPAVESNRANHTRNLERALERAADKVKK